MRDAVVMRRSVQTILLSLFRTKEFFSNIGTPRHDSFPISADYYPKGLGIEVTNLCNANCVFCAYRYRARPVAFMSQEMFETLIDQYVSMGGGEGGIGLTPIVGDPLIDRSLVRKIAYARSFHQMKAIHLTTNAILLTRELFEKLVDAGVTMMTVSMSGFDAEEYNRVFRNSNYSKVIENLRAVADSDRFTKCEVEIGLRTDSLFPWLKKEYWEFRALGFKISRNWFFDNWSGQIQDEDLAHFMFLRPERRLKRIPCHVLFAGPQILADGVVTACGCRDLEGTSELRLGTIYESSLKELVSDGKIEALRKRFIDGKLPDLCRDCKHYSPMTVSRHKTLMANQSVSGS